MLESMLVISFALAAPRPGAPAPKPESPKPEASSPQTEATDSPDGGEKAAPRANPADSPAANLDGQDSPTPIDASHDDRRSAGSSDGTHASSWDDVESSPTEASIPIGVEGSGDSNPRVAGLPPPTRTDTAVRGRGYASSDREIRYRIEALANVGTQSTYHDEYRAFDSDNRTMFVFEVGGRTDFALAASRVFLGAGALYRQGASSGTLGGSSDLLIREPLVFVRCSVRLLEGLDLYVEPGGGPSIVDVDLEGATSASQRTVIGMFNGYGGATAYMPRGWLPRGEATRFTAGLDLGLGYVYRSPFDVEPEVSVEDDDIDIQSPNLGELRLDGLVWRAGLFVRFM